MTLCMGVIGEGGSGDLNVVRGGPNTRGVTAPRACSDAGSEGRGRVVCVSGTGLACIGGRGETGCGVVSA